ncbi:MAG: hypothetical protein EZS28_041147, partial [Streblomastix strix]
IWAGGGNVGPCVEMFVKGMEDGCLSSSSGGGFNVRNLIRRFVN